jgi:hypothetical protein
MRSDNYVKPVDKCGYLWRSVDIAIGAKQAKSQNIPFWTARPCQITLNKYAAAVACSLPTERGHGETSSARAFAADFPQYFGERNRPE